MKSLLKWLDQLERSHSWWAPIVIVALCFGFSCVVILLLIFTANINSSLGAL